MIFLEAWVRCAYLRGGEACSLVLVLHWWGWVGLGWGGLCHRTLSNKQTGNTLSYAYSYTSCIVMLSCVWALWLAWFLHHVFMVFAWFGEIGELEKSSIEGSW